MEINIKEIISSSLILFSVIDILGAIPIIIDLRKKNGDIQSGQATLVSGLIMVGFFFAGKFILAFLGVDTNSFAVAGALILFLIGLEMTLGRNIFKNDTITTGSHSIVPLAFPIIAGAGTMTTLISLKSQFEEVNILISIFINLIFIYLVLRSSVWIERKLGNAGTQILRKVFGVILIAIAIKIFKTRLL
jgi:multiple antibiotic resistance protein